MGRVTGIGGVFFKAKNPLELIKWYQDNLGVPLGEFPGSVQFQWKDDPLSDSGSTTWALFPQDTDYFGDSGQPYMINYRVEDLDGLLVKLRSAGAKVDDKVDEYEYGRFAWFSDPEGNRVELWEPPAGT